MNRNILKQYNVLIIRYNSEIWLKSTKVKIRMVKTLINNVKSTFKKHGIGFYKYKLSNDSTRIFFNLNNDIMNRAIETTLNTFGVESVSPAIRTSNKIEHIINRAFNIAQEVLNINDTFALRVKRSGEHSYSSQEVAAKVGQAIIDHFKHLSLKVNLSDPMKVIHIEIRGDFSYIFTNIYKSNWAGLPIENRKFVAVLDVGRISDLIGGFMLIKRGCRFLIFFFDLSSDTNKFNKVVENWRNVLKIIPFSKITLYKIDILPILLEISSKNSFKNYVCAICRILRFSSAAFLLKIEKFKGFSMIRAFTDGLSFNNCSKCSDKIDLQSIRFNSLFSDYPIFTPLAGLTKNEILETKNKISHGLLSNQYCSVELVDQKFKYETLKEIVNRLDLQSLLKSKLTYSKVIIKLNSQSKLTM